MNMRKPTWPILAVGMLIKQELFKSGPVIGEYIHVSIGEAVFSLRVRYAGRKRRYGRSSGSRPVRFEESCDQTFFLQNPKKLYLAHLEKRR